LLPVGDRAARNGVGSFHGAICEGEMCATMKRLAEIVAKCSQLLRVSVFRGPCGHEPFEI
jgi:hypothetical protein